jgi:hypothetical protein
VGSGGKAAEKLGIAADIFGKVVGMPTELNPADSEVGPPNAEDMPPAVVGMPTELAAPANEVGTFAFEAIEDKDN